MKQKLLISAVLAAFAAPAMADESNVTVYGLFDLSYDVINTGTGAAAANGVANQSGTSSGRVSSNTSKIGFKGNEDLGDGLKAVWQLEQTIYPGASETAKAGKATLGTRNTFLGLSSASAGTILMGRHDTPYKMSTRSLDVFGDGIADNRNLMGVGTASFDGRQDQVVAYVSPKLGDAFTLAAGYVNLSNPMPNLSTSAKSSALSVAGMYDANGIYAALAYESHDFTSAAPAVSTNERATRAGLGYKGDAFSIGAVYESTKDNLGAAFADKNGHKAAYVGAKFKVSDNDTIKLAYAKLGNRGNVANTGATQASLGFDHSFSKRTTIYALYTKLNQNTATNIGLSGEASIGGATTSSGFGSAPSAFAVGLKHSF